MKGKTYPLLTSLVVLSLYAPNVWANPLRLNRAPNVWELSQKPDANEDRFIQNQDELPSLPNDDPFLPPTEEPNVDILDNLPNDDEPNEDETTFILSDIQVTGSTVFTEEDFAPILEPLKNRPITFDDLEEAARAITALYTQEGYLASQAVLSPQAVGDTAVIEVAEGKLTDVQVSGLRYLKPDYVRSRVLMGIDQNKPLKTSDIEDQLRLLSVDPMLRNLDVGLQPGANPGDTVLILDVNDARRFGGAFTADSYSSASVGQFRNQLDLFYNNVSDILDPTPRSGLGDTLSFSWSRTTTGGSNFWDMAYRVPLNPMNGTLVLRSVVDRNTITQSPFDDLGIEGQSESYDLSYRQPLIRTPREEFALSFAFSHKRGQTFLFNNIGTPFSSGAEADGTTRTAVLRFGQEYLMRDSKGLWNFRSQINWGTGLLDSTINSGSTPDGRFVSWSGQVQRLQSLAPNNLLVMGFEVQFSPNNLLSSESFSIGGAQTVRGYRQGARSGDNGWRLSVEDRITLMQGRPWAQSLQIAPFFEVGSVWNNPSNPDQISSDHVLAGIGTGILWSPIANLNLRMDFALPLIELDNRQNSLQDDGIYFSATYTF